LNVDSTAIVANVLSSAALAEDKASNNPALAAAIIFMKMLQQKTFDNMRNPASVGSQPQLESRPASIVERTHIIIAKSFGSGDAATSPRPLD
jgi:hypothetical protein